MRDPVSSNPTIGVDGGVLSPQEAAPSHSDAVFVPGRNETV